MKTPTTGVLLRVFIGSSDQWHGTPLYEALVLKAREMKLAGATVLRGIMGFGKNSRIHTANILTLSTDLPLIIEIIDEENKIQSFLPVVDEMVKEGMVTLENVSVFKYTANASSPPEFTQ